jgi:hypothetical protein
MREKLNRTDLWRNRNETRTGFRGITEPVAKGNYYAVVRNGGMGQSKVSAMPRSNSASFS